MAARSPREAVYSVKSPLVPPQQAVYADPRSPDLNSGPLLSDPSVQRSNSTKRRKANEQSPRLDIGSEDRPPSAPEPPRAPRGPPLSYRNPYETGDQFVEKGHPSSRSFAARAGILPEQFSPRSPQFAESISQERSPVVASRPTSQRTSQGAAYQNAPPVEDRRESRRTSRPQSYEPQNVEEDPSEPRYGSVSTGKVVQHQRPVSDVRSGTNGRNYADQPVSPQVENTSIPTRSRSKRYSTPQQVSAAEKSPLQKLELKLNDIAKEEKRARVELAEQKLREREAVSGKRTSQQDIPVRQSSASKRSVSGPIYQRLSEQSRDPERRRSHREVPDLQVDTGAKRQQTDSTTPRNSRSISGATSTNQSTSRRVSSGAERNDDRGVRFQNQTEDIQAKTPQEPANGVTTGILPKVHRGDITEGSSSRNTSKALKPDVIPPRAVRSGNEHLNYGIPPQTAAAVDARKSVGFGTDAALENPAQEKKHHFSGLFHRHHKDVVDQTQPIRGLDEWKKGGIALLTLADMKASAQTEDKTKDKNYKAWWEGQQADGRKSKKPEPAPETDQMDGFFDEQLGKTTSHNKLRKRRIPVEVINTFSEESPKHQKASNKHRREPILQGVYKLARISYADRNTSPWSKSHAPEQKISSERRSDRGDGIHALRDDKTSHGTSANHSSAITTFEPPLLLKCGPLLRYCGMRTEKPANQGSTGREFWRGSIMIVTEDHTSDYSTVPSLRLFHQPMQLLPPPPKQFDEDAGEGLDSEYVDPIGGLPKLTRTGGTVYVKPIEDLDEGVDVSRIENDDGLYEETRTANVPTSYGKADELLGRSPHHSRPPPQRGTGRQVGRYREVTGIRLHAERGFTFWRFKVEVELGEHQQRIAYRINRGASVGFWVPARGKSMNIMFHSCNGFSMSVDSNLFSGPDPLWRDVLNAHQIKPFHVMIGGGDQIYNDAVMKQTTLFAEWLDIKNPHHKHEAQFTPELRNELESFYLERYCMWFSQGLFGMANSQIPMVNMWDDHDIIDGFGSYPHHFMSTPVFSGVGNVAFKYYMLFQQQSVTDELTPDEPSWLLGASPGPYINELSRSIFMSLGGSIALLALDCRTERMRDEIMSEASYDLVFERCHREIVKGETKHLIVLLGVPIAYPRLVWLENVLTSRVLDPVKALGRMGLLGNFMNKFDGGVEILDDLDDHWTAKNHKEERNWFIEELQELAAEKSVRITILGGDVHLAAVGQFFSNKALNIPKDQDFRYMPNVISSAIVNTPPPDMMADILNKRNKIHHLNAETDENMIPMFTHDVDGKPRNNKHLLPKRNWCSISEYLPGATPPPTPPSLSPTASQTSLPQKSPGLLQRTLSLGRGDSKPTNKLIRRLSLSNKNASSADEMQSPYTPGQPSPYGNVPTTPRYDEAPIPTRPISNFHRRPTNLPEKAAAKGAANDLHVDLEHGLDISLNCEIKQGDPSGSTEQYRLLVPALMYDGPLPEHKKRKAGLMKRFGSRKSAPPSAYPGISGGSKTGSRDSWAGGSKESVDSQSISSQNSQGPPVQTGLFRRLSNRFSRSASQNRGQSGGSNVLQKRRVSMDAQPPVRALEPFKARPTSQAGAQIHQQQQPLQSAMRHSSADNTGVYTVTHNTPRSQPTSFSQKPYNPVSTPQSKAQTATPATQRSEPQAQTQSQAQPTSFNRTAPIPRSYSFSESDLSDAAQDNKSFSTDDEAEATNSRTRNGASTGAKSKPSPVAQQPTTVPRTSGSTSTKPTVPLQSRNQPRTTANTPSGRGSGAAKFFGEDLPSAPAPQQSKPATSAAGAGAGSGGGGGYSGIQAYGHSGRGLGKLTSLLTKPGTQRAGGKYYADDNEDGGYDDEEYSDEGGGEYSDGDGEGDEYYRQDMGHRAHISSGAGGAGDGDGKKKGWKRFFQ